MLRIPGHCRATAAATARAPDLSQCISLLNGLLVMRPMLRFERMKNPATHGLRHLETGVVCPKRGWPASGVVAQVA